MQTLPWEELGKSLRITDELRAALGDSYVDFSRSFSHLVGSFEDPSISLLTMPPVVSQMPGPEFFNATQLLNVITIEKPNTELAEQEELASEQIRQETEEALEPLLANLDPSLVRLWRGAQAALVSRNPDRIRHFVTSLRELFTHVLHRLAPDDEVHAWSTSPEHFSQGRPTRRARLLYICDPIDHHAFRQFVEKDVTLVLEFLSLFQRGTHEVDVSYTEPQLLALRVRMESVIRFMLEVNRCRM